VKKMPVTMMMLLVMGLILLPACDEEKGMDPAEMLLLYNSQFYLEFDADYDNDRLVDEHVKMRMKEPFKIRQVGPGHYFNTALFIDGEKYISIYLPTETTGPAPIYFTEDTDNFSFTHGEGFDSYDSYYTSYTSDTFNFMITTWGNKGGVVSGNFEGYLYDWLETERIYLSNGVIYCRKI
jgi:hypothetical protein